MHARMTRRMVIFTMLWLVLIGGAGWLPGAVVTTASVKPAQDIKVYLPLVFNAGTASGMMADTGFRPKPNGFGFENWGNEPENATDLNADDMIKLFGRDKVCANAAGECVLSAAAREW